MIFSGQEMGWKDQPVSILQQESLDQFYTPETGDVTNAYVDDAFLGVGTQNADNLRNQVIEFEKTGTPLTEEAYKNSDYYRSTIPYYKDITAESAKLLSEYEDEQSARAFTISKATTAQDILGFTSAFIAGTVEPKNLIFGAATAGIGAGVLSLRRLVKMRQALGRYGSMAAIGTAEGFVSAIAAEPSNRYSARVLHQDYTMADSAWNVATSAVLGAGLSTAPTFVKDKFKRRKFNRAFEDYIDEVETSITQLAQGQKIDIAAIEKINDGVIAKKPVAEKAAMVEAFVRSEPLPEINTIAKVKAQVVDAVVVRQEARIEPTISEPLKPDLSPRTVRDLQTPASWIVRDKATNKAVFETSSNEVAAKINTERYEAVPVIEHLANLNGQSYYAKPDAEIKAEAVRQATLGADTLDSVVQRMDNQNLEVAKQAAVTGNDPANSSAIDYEAARAVEEYDTTIDQMIEYEEEIAALREQGLLSEADEMALSGFDEFNLDDAASAYQAAYFCLTRG